MRYIKAMAHGLCGWYPVFFKALSALCAVFYLHFVGTWALLHIFPGTAIAHMWFYWPISSAALVVMLTPDHWYGRKKQLFGRWIFGINAMIFCAITWWFWRLGCDMEREKLHRLRETAGNLLGLSGAIGFEIVFLASIFLVLCFIALISSLEKYCDDEKMRENG